MTACTELAPGCYSGPAAPTVTDGLTDAAALKEAAGSDRLVAVLSDGRRFCIPQQDDRKLGAGRLGNGVSLAAAIRDHGFPRI